ncbi:MAG: AbrB family transcriptional regulator [Gammaproteobacteria bacterium]|nr:AbrB family transcriptional regulator [Gammaproteobacteria bacterium]
MAALDIRFLAIFACGLIGGGIAFVLGIPMPFMLGGIMGAACFVLWYEREGKRLPKLSRWVRLIFMSIIGSMIGSRFSPELLTLLPQFWISGLTLIPFIFLAHGGNYAIMRGLGRYKKKDAYFAALPGGIIDSAALAEQAGADLRIVTTQHFIRIIFVVSSVPLLFLFIGGSVVGSASGESMASADYDFLDIALVVSIAFIGLIVGRIAKLPVSHMLGPLLLALALSVGGVVEIDLPPWLSHAAQYMVGTALGAQFSGVSRRLLVRGLGLGVLSGCYMLLLAGMLAAILVQFVPADFGAMFISFAAGGLAEMSLIALSLNFNPVVVALHHLVRILLTVSLGSFMSRHVFKLMPTR